MTNIKVLVIDNYDSFTYNLYQYVQNCGIKDIDVLRNDAFKIGDLEKYSHILISPGPGIPSEAGLTIQVIQRYASSKSILGICLGHQAIAEAFGGELLNRGKVIHGKANTTEIIDSSLSIFHSLPDKIETGRYHSWIVSNENFPEELEITAIDHKNEIMGLCHKKYRVYGLQFHPESILTPLGYTIIQNWLELT